MGRTGFPVRSLAREATGDHPVVGELVGGEPTVDTDDAGAVGENVAQGDAVLARRGELGPSRGDGLVQLHRSVLRQQRHHERGGALGRGVDAGQRVTGHLVPGPQIDHLPAVHERRELGAGRTSVLGDYGGEHLTDRLETTGHGPVHIDLVHPFLLRSSSVDTIDSPDARSAENVTAPRVVTSRRSCSSDP